MTETVSVIVPAFNREKLIVRALDSILNSSRQPDELIVVDNDSTDGTYKVVQEWINAHSDTTHTFLKLIRELKPGACAARNAGIENSSGNFIICFDSDDAMRPNLIDEAMKRVENDKEIDIVCWNCEIHLLDGSKRIPSVIKSDLLQSQIIHSLLRPQGYIVKRSFIDKAGGWNEELFGWNDWELGIRLFLQNPHIYFLEETLADIYAGKESITGENFSSKEQVWEKSLSSAYETVEKSNHKRKAEIMKMIDYRRIILAAHYAREGNKTGAKRLTNDVFGRVSGKSRWLLTLAYNYTRLGGRGIWRLLRPLF